MYCRGWVEAIAIRCGARSNCRLVWLQDGEDVVVVEKSRRRSNDFLLRRAASSGRRTVAAPHSTWRATEDAELGTESNHAGKV